MPEFTYMGYLLDQECCQIISEQTNYLLQIDYQYTKFV